MENFISAKYRELREEEQLFFQAVPTMRVAKKLIQFAALPPAAAVAATHAPIVGPVVAGAVGQATHLMHSGIHGVAADQIAKNFAEIAGQIQPGWGKQSAFNAWANVRTADMLAKTDAWARPLSGFAAPTMIGKGIVDTGKLAISYAKQGIPTVVARPVAHMWKMTNHYINRAQQWFEETLNKLPEQVQQNVRSAIETVQRRQATMADAQNQVPTEQDMDRRNDYVRMLSEQRNEPNLTFEGIQTDVKDVSDLGADYDRQVVYQALQEGKTLDEATAIIAQGPNVTQMSEANLQDVSVYLSETTNAVWEQYNIDNPSPDASQDQSVEAAPESVVSQNETVVEPNDQLDPDQEQSTQLQDDFEVPQDPLVDEPDTQPEVEASERREQYIELLAEELGEPDLTWETIQDRVNQTPDLQDEYNAKVADVAMQKGFDPEEAKDIVFKGSPEWDGVERPPVVEQPEVKPESKMSAEDDLLENFVRKLEGTNADLTHLNVLLDGKQIFKMQNGSILPAHGNLSQDKVDLIKAALNDPQNFKGSMVIRQGAKVLLNIKNGRVLSDRAGLTTQGLNAEVESSTEEKPVEPKLTERQKRVAKSMETQGIDTKEFVKTATAQNNGHVPTIEKQAQNLALSR